MGVRRANARRTLYIIHPATKNKAYRRPPQKSRHTDSHKNAAGGANACAACFAKRKVFNEKSIGLVLNLYAVLLEFMYVWATRRQCRAPFNFSHCFCAVTCHMARDWRADMAKLLQNLRYAFAAVAPSARHFSSPSSSGVLYTARPSAINTAPSPSARACQVRIHSPSAHS